MSDNVFSRLVEQEVTSVRNDGTPQTHKGRGLQDRVVRYTIGNMANADYQDWTNFSAAIRKLDPAFGAWQLRRIQGYADAVVRNQKARSEGLQDERQWTENSFSDDMLKAAQYLARTARSLSGGVVAEEETQA